MCGIVGYIGPRDATPIILNGLKRLEYRGYDSAGLAVVHHGKLEVRKDAGKLSQLVELVERSPIQGAPGVGHTRWATHGAPSARNAHPHLGQTERVVVVHNGIVENFLELKDELSAEGVQFNSDTDTESIVHLVEHYKAAGSGFEEAARRSLMQMKGANVVVLLSADEPDKSVALAALQASAQDSIRQQGCVSFLVIAENFEGWRDGDDWSDVSFMDNDPYIRKMAIVGEKQWEQILALIFAASPIRKFPIEYFQPAELERARAWLAAE